MRIEYTKLSIIILGIIMIALTSYHTLLSKKEKRATASRTIYDYLTLIITILWGGYLFLFLIIPQYYIQKYLSFIYPLSIPLQISGLVITLSGLLLIDWSFRSLGKYWSMWTELKDGHRLIQHGPYRFIRHPIYSSFILIYFGTLLLTHSTFLLILFPSIIIYYLRAKKEESLLKSSFGEEYQEYMNRTKRLIPFVF